MTISPALCALALTLALSPAGAAGAPLPAANVARPAPLAPPAIVRAPRITGSSQTGARLAATHGSWSGHPTSYAYSWKRCSAVRCRTLPGANAATYTPGEADAGESLSVVVTAANAAGSSAPAASAPTALVAGAHGARPVSLSPPAIAGSAQPGAPLSASSGSWTQTPLSYEYEWERCDAVGEACAAIPLASGASYTVGEADAGSTLRVLVIALNGAGESAPAVSAPSALVSSSAPPVNVVAPTLAGPAHTGAQLTATPGVWQGAPRRFAYRWKRCNSHGLRCRAIAAASAATYVLAARDTGRTVRVTVTATNSSGRSAPALSAPSAVVTPGLGEPPSDLTPPQLSGLAALGQLLSATPGAWVGSPTSFSYQWERCSRRGTRCAPIPGATGATYLLGALDVGATVRVAVIATNAAGASAAADSPPSAVVSAQGAARHLEYVFGNGTVNVYDVDNAFNLVETFALPGTSRGVRGVMVSPLTHMLFVSYGGDGGGNGNGSVLAYDLLAKRVLWSVHLRTGIDSGAVSPDGKRLYMPDGELSSNGNWYILDTATGGVLGKIETPGSGPHDGVMSADGRLLALGDRNYSQLLIYNTQTGRLQAKIGPLAGGVRPNTINGADSVAFTTATGLDGFQVESITGASVLFSERFASCEGPFSTCSHGISLSPDNRQVYVIDTVHKAVQVWDVHGVAQGVAPTHVATVPVDGLEGTEKGCAYDCGRDGWLQHTLDGRFVFAGDTGDVIETATHTVVARIANLLNTRKFVEIDWSGGRPTASSGRQGIGLAP
ncbi:MAG TPA: hypothetical protein VNZ05_08025 [Solirubrobacteraceae bacterium]|nr:hypothetical protein [Solirubrobacteraceae bacterium]